VQWTEVTQLLPDDPNSMNTTSAASAELHSPEKSEDLAALFFNLSPIHRKTVKQYPHIIRTVRALMRLAKRFDTPQYSDVITHLELLNEPLYNIDLAIIKSFYLTAIEAIRKLNPQSQMTIVMHDSFRLGAWGGFAAEHQMSNIMFDTHHYQVFMVDQLKWSREQHIENICQATARVLRDARQNSGPLIVGEWCGATTDCALW